MSIQGLEAREFAKWHQYCLLFRMLGTGDCVNSERELLGLGATLVGDGKPESLANAQGR